MSTLSGGGTPSPDQDSLLKKLEKELTCPVCLLQLKEPKFLQCHHIFCRCCIQQLTKQELMEINCPICRQATPLPFGGVADLQTASIIQNIMDHIHEVSGHGRQYSDHTLNLDAPIVSIEGAEGPWGVAMGKTKEEVFVVENGGNCVSVFNDKGAKLRSFGTCGSCEGQFDSPRGVAVDSEGCVLVVDEKNHRVQKFSEDGKLLTTVGRRGNGHLEFEFPHGIAVHPHTQDIYITEIDNQRVQVLKKDLTFSHSFGRRGRSDGEFMFPFDVSCSASGKVYVADTNSIQVFTDKGSLIDKFDERHRDDMKQVHPVCICISDDVVFVSRWEGNRVMAFSDDGKPLVLDERGKGESVCHPRGMAMDGRGRVWLADQNHVRCFEIKM